jgi:lysophospholipase L1-like esterase
VRSGGKTALAAGASIVLFALAAATGSARARPPLLLVALGDSTAYGRYECGGCRTFVRRFAAALAHSSGRRVRVENLARPTPLESGALRAQLEANGPMRAAVARARAVMVIVGHDDKPWRSSSDSCDGPAVYPDVDWSSYDSCLGENVDRYETDLAAILALVRELRRGKPTLVRATIDYNDLIGRAELPRLGAEVSQELAEDYAFATCEAALRFRADCIDVLHAFNGLSGLRPAVRFLTRDRTHPNARGHRVIANLLVRAGFGALRRR